MTRKTFALSCESLRQNIYDVGLQSYGVFIQPVTIGSMELKKRSFSDEKNIKVSDKKMIMKNYPKIKKSFG